MTEPTFELFHFHPAYEVEVEPEFPGSGDWGVPVYGFSRDGRVAEPFESRWGAPLVLLVTTPTARWVAMFPAGGLGGITGVFACPSPINLCALADGQAYLLNVETPAEAAAIAHDQVTQVVPVTGRDLLLLVRMIDIVAIGPAGMAWRSARLAVDHLRVVDATADAITCSAWMLEDELKIVMVDPLTGEGREDPRLERPWNA